MIDYSGHHSIPDAHNLHSHRKSSYSQQISMENLYSHKNLFSFLLLPLHFSSLLLLLSAYDLPDKYFINCGSESDITLGNRIFVGDVNSGFSFSVGKSIYVKDTNQSTNTSPNIYQTARVYRHQSSYEIEIDQTGVYFVRLHFFVFSSRINLASALFNVSASGFSLLSNFSLQNSSNQPLIKEFLLKINAGKFTILFIPSQESSPAFVNAIEVFLAPESFIPDKAPRVTSAGSAGTYGGLLSQVLHTIYRINVGGSMLTPENDSLWRYWKPDDEYLVYREAAKDYRSDNVRLKYVSGGATEYIAPAFVYKTAKILNIDYSRGSNFSNVTWSFEVIKNSKHLVRVHFCDIVSQSYDVAQFNLYIYSKFSQRINPYETTRLIEAPVYSDVVVVSDDSGLMKISIGPRNDTWNQNQTAFLNGLEIMELMKKSGSDPMQSKPKKNQLFVIVGSVGGGAFFIILIVVVSLSVKCWKAKPDQTSRWPLSVAPYGGSSSYNRLPERNANVSAAPNLNLELRIPYTEIQHATENFDAKLLIGKGGFGNVYVGTLRGIKVAVKRSESESGQGLAEFQTEIMVLSQIRHRNLVSLFGYCDERSEMILVYEFMERGTLREHLYDSNGNSERSSATQYDLSWKQRLEICIGAAEGLHYLHTGSAGGIIHRDVKSTNILLDKHYVAKVADFGLSKSVVLLDAEDVSTNIKGSFGYLDPEYLRTLQLTKKTDVYAFGVVLLEVLCARPAIISSVDSKEVNLADWGMLWRMKGQLEKIIDPVLVGKINPNSLRKFGETIEKCLKASGTERPAMRDVLWDLKYALRLQQTVMPREPHDDSTTISSLELGVPTFQCLPSNSFPVEENGAPPIR